MLDAAEEFVVCVVDDLACHFISIYMKCSISKDRRQQMNYQSEVWSWSYLSVDVEGVFVSHVFVEFLLPAPSLLLLVEFLL